MAKGEMRVGRKNPYTLYLMVGDEPSDNDTPIGFCRLATVARQVVEGYNRGLLWSLHRGWTDLGHDDDV